MFSKYAVVRFANFAFLNRVVKELVQLSMGLRTTNLSSLLKQKRRTLNILCRGSSESLMLCLAISAS